MEICDLDLEQDLRVEGNGYGYAANKAQIFAPTPCLMANIQPAAGLT
jgi:hypothetical protein